MGNTCERNKTTKKKKFPFNDIDRITDNFPSFFENDMRIRCVYESLITLEKENKLKCGEIDKVIALTKQYIEEGSDEQAWILFFQRCQYLQIDKRIYY